jgi:signal transduction histidine kinase
MGDFIDKEFKQINISDFKTILDNIDRKIYICDKKTKELLYANKAAIKMAGAGSKLTKNITCHKFFFGFDSPCPNCILPEHYTDDKLLSRDTYIKAENRWAHVDVKPISFGNREALVIYSHDVTDQKKHEEHYKLMVDQVESLYPDVLGSFHLNLTKNWCGEGRSPLGFVMKQQEKGTVDGYFAEFSKLIAYQSVRNRFADIFDREKLIQIFHRGHTRVEIEYPIEYEDGIHWRLGRLYMFENPTTGDVEARTYAIDIDERKKRDFIVQELVDTDFDFVALLNLKTNKVKEYTSKGRSYYIDSKMAETDYTAAMIASIKNFIRPDLIEEAIEAHRIETIKAKLAESSVYRLSFPTNDNRIEAWRISYLEPNKHYVLIARRDVTKEVEKEKQQIQKLRQAKLQAEQANEAKSSFLSSMSHDLRTPLNGVIGYTELALQEDSVETKQDYLKKIQSSGRLLLDMVNDTLDLSRIESGKLVLKPEVVDGKKYWEDIVIAMAPVADVKNVKLNTDFSKYPRQMIKVDRVQVKKVLINILSNAIKYTPSGGSVTINVEALQPPQKGCSRRIIVADTGIGMSREFMKRMFDPFAQEQRSEALNVTGTGLGLSIVKRIVDFLGGNISVESTLYKGTKFTIDLPIETWDKKADDEKSQ